MADRGAQAVAALERAVAIQSDHSEALHALSDALLRTGRTAEGQKRREESEQLRTKDGDDQRRRRNTAMLTVQAELKMAGKGLRGGDRYSGSRSSHSRAATGPATFDSQRRMRRPDASRRRRRSLRRRFHSKPGRRRTGVSPRSTRRSAGARTARASGRPTPRSVWRSFGRAGRALAIRAVVPLM